MARTVVKCSHPKCATEEQITIASQDGSGWGFGGSQTARPYCPNHLVIHDPTRWAHDAHQLWDAEAASA